MFLGQHELGLSSVGCIRAFDRISRNIHQACHVAGTVFCNDTQEDYEMVMVGTHDVAGGANASSIAYWISSSGLKYWRTTMCRVLTNAADTMTESSVKAGTFLTFWSVFQRKVPVMSMGASGQR